MTTPSNKLFEIRVTPFGLGIFISILLHILLLILQIQKSTRTAQKVPEPIEVSQITPEQLKEMEKHIVETDKADNKTVDPNARFYSSQNQKVEKQTKSQNVDAFRQNKGAGVAKNPGGKKETEMAKKEEDLTPSPIDLTDSKKEAKNKKDWKSLSLKDLSVAGDGGPSAATDDHLKNVDTGEQTILSTREFRYFSYYHRIKELLRQHWKPNVEAKMYRLYERGRNITSDEFTTKVLVLLNENGSIQKISKVAGSGINEFDEAAVEAFEKAAPFPNPPRGIIDSDGFVRIRWDFILQTEANPRIQFVGGNR